MSACIEVMEEAFRETASGRGMDRPRAHSYFPTGREDQVYLFKSFEGGVLSRGVVATRLCSYFNEFIHVGDSYQTRRVAGSAAERGLVLLFSIKTAQPLCIMPDRHIQSYRVAATYALGTRYLARQNASVLGLYGSGLQARTGLLAHSFVRKFRKVRVYSPTPDHRNAFAREMEGLARMEIEPVDNPRAVMKGADVILAATSSIEPVVRGSWLEPGMQVTAINNCADQEALDRIELFARTGGGQPQNFYCGDVRVGNRTTVESVPTVDLSKTIALGDVMLGQAGGRTSEEQITSFGLTGGEGGRGIQFAAAGGYVYEKACEKGIGSTIDLEWS